MSTVRRSEIRIDSYVNITAVAIILLRAYEIAQHILSKMSITSENIDEQKIQNYIDCFETVANKGETPKFACKVENCELFLSAKCTAIRHLKRVHDQVYDAIKHKKNEEKTNTDQSTTNICELRVKIDPDEIKQACVKLITDNGLPLSFVEYPAFKSIIKPYIIALELKGVKLIINRQNIRDEIEKKSNQIKALITSETRNRLLSLMVDIGSRYNRSILGVNIGYIIDGKIVVRTIGMSVLRFSHTAENIVEMIKQNLADFGIVLEQIVSGTTDNGMNMLKSVAILDSQFQSQNKEPSEQADDSSSDEQQIDDDIFDESYYQDLLTNVRHGFNDLCYTDLIHGVSCAAHCIHLIVTKAIDKCEEAKTILEKCRSLVRKLRTPTFNEMLIAHKFLVAKIDVPTRWNSIFFMVTTFM